MSNNRNKILDVALKCAESGKFTRQGIARAAGLAPNMVTYYFGSWEETQDEVMTAAIKTKNIPALAYGLRIQNPVAMAAPEALKKKAAKFLISQ